MSKYTTEVRYICETAAGRSESGGFNDIDEILNLCVDNVFNFNFPIFDENYRKPLEKKILKYYYTREISEETVGLWKLRLCNKLNEIMPYYNKLYASEIMLDGVDLFTDVNITTDHKLKKSGNSVDKNKSKNTSIGGNETKANDSSANIDLFSATPQGALSENDLFISSSGGVYLTNARKITDTNNTDSKNSDYRQGENKNETLKQFNDVDEYLEHIIGKRGGKSYGEMLIEIRKTFINIDKMIIDDLSTLFFGLW